MPSWTVRLLGGEDLAFRRRSRDDLPDVVWPVFAALLTSPYVRLSRSRLAGMLWPERDEQSARHCLASAMWRIRTKLGARESPFVLGEESIGLRGSGLWIDCLVFRRRAEEVLADPEILGHSTARARLRRALGLYRGPLLIDRPQEWIAIERERLRSLYIDAQYALATSDVAAGRWERVRESARRICDIEPFREDAQRLLMSALAHCGCRALALAQYRSLERLLLSELAIAPMAETTELARQLAKGLDQPEPPERPAIPLAIGLALGLDQREAVRRVRRHLSSSIDLIDEDILG